MPEKVVSSTYSDPPVLYRPPPVAAEPPEMTFVYRLAAPAEMQTLARNDRLLRQIAERTGGQYDNVAGLPDLVDEILAAYRRVAGEPVKPHLARMYNFPLLFVIFVAAVTAEWVLRRRWQLR